MDDVKVQVQGSGMCEFSPANQMRGSSSRFLQPCPPPRGELSSFARNTWEQNHPQHISLGFDRLWNFQHSGEKAIDQCHLM